MKLKIVKHGDSLGVNIPSNFVKGKDLKKGDYVEIKEDDIRKVK